MGSIHPPLREPTCSSPTIGGSCRSHHWIPRRSWISWMTEGRTVHSSSPRSYPHRHGRRALGNAPWLRSSSIVSFLPQCRSKLREHPYANNLVKATESRQPRKATESTKEGGERTDRAWSSDTKSTTPANTGVGRPLLAGLLDTVKPKLLLEGLLAGLIPKVPAYRRHVARPPT